MPTVTIAFEYTDEAERFAREQAVAFLTQMRRVAGEAPDGTVLAAGEEVALRDGHALLRNSLAAAVRGRVAAAEQQGGSPAPGPAACGRAGRPKGRHARGPDGGRADRGGPHLVRLPGLRSRRLRGRPRLGHRRLPDRGGAAPGLPGGAAGLVRPGRETADGTGALGAGRRDDPPPLPCRSGAGVGRPGGSGDGRGVRRRPRRWGAAHRRGHGQHPGGLARPQGGGAPPGTRRLGRRRRLGPTGPAAPVDPLGDRGDRGGVGVRGALRGGWV